MTLAFYIISFVLLASAALAVSLRNLIHCAFAAALSFLSVGALFFMLKAEFIGAIQILIYVGAVATLILFTIMLTHQVIRSAPYRGQKPKAGLGIVMASAVLWVLVGAIRSQTNLAEVIVQNRAVDVASLGKEMLTTYLLPFEVISLLLTAAMIGGIVLALEKKKEKETS